MPEPARQIRFGLPSLLILPLGISPLFLSAVTRELLEHNKPSAASFYNILACTAAYAAVFTARRRRRVYDRGGAGPRHVLPAVTTGALFGMVFMTQIAIPCLLATMISQGHSRDSSLIASIRANPAWAVDLVIGIGVGLCVVGLVFGAFGGSLVGLVFDRRFAHARMQRAEAPPAK